jgi:hypothetical protein
MMLGRGAEAIAEKVRRRESERGRRGRSLFMAWWVEERNQTRDDVARDRVESELFGGEFSGVCRLDGSLGREGVGADEEMAVGQRNGA